MHAAAWKKLFDGFLKQRATRQASHSSPSTSTPTTRATSTASRATTAWQPSSSHAGSSCRWAHPKMARRAKRARARQSEGPVFPETPRSRTASRSMNPRSRWCANSGRRRSRPPSSRPATTARRCSRQPASRSCSTRAWTGRISPVSSSRASRRPMLFWKRRGASGWNLHVPSSWRTRSPAWQPGAPAGFGCVIGVDRGGHAQALREAGADVVVTDMAQVRIAVEPPSAWSLVYEGFDPAREGIREALCTLGNGYFATRGAAAWAVADGIHYPGTYLAGGYNRLRTEIAGRDGRERGPRQFPQLARARVSNRRGGLVRCANRHDSVLPPGTRSAARHAVAEHQLRGRRRDGAVRSRSDAWSRWTTCTWARWS